MPENLAGLVFDNHIAFQPAVAFNDLVGIGGSLFPLFQVFNIERDASKTNAPFQKVFAKRKRQV